VPRGRWGTRARLQSASVAAPAQVSLQYDRELVCVAEGGDSHLYAAGSVSHVALVDPRSPRVTAYVDTADGARVPAATPPPSLSYPKLGAHLVSCSLWSHSCVLADQPASGSGAVRGNGPLVHIIGVLFY